MKFIEIKRLVVLLSLMTVMHVVEVRATSWAVDCKEDEIAVADGIDTMTSPPVCKKLAEVKKEYEDKCAADDLYGCMRRWNISGRFGAEDQVLWRNKYLEKSKELCHKGSPDACGEVWRVILNETYPMRLAKNVVEMYHKGKRIRTEEERETMIKYIKLACEKAKTQNHSRKDYLCGRYDDSKYY